MGEDFVWYGYRKWRALAHHLAHDHCRQQSLQNRRIVARERRIQEAKEKKSKDKAA